MAVRSFLQLVIALTIFAAEPHSLWASDYDYGADTLPFLLENSECVVWTSDADPISIERNGLVTLVASPVHVGVAGECELPSVQFVLPPDADPELARDALLFLGPVISSSKADRLGCGASCKLARDLTSGSYGMVSYTSRRHIEVLSYQVSSLDDAELDWANSIIQSPGQDAFLQNSAIYVVAREDASLERGTTVNFFENLFSSTNASVDVKLFGVSALSLQSSGSAAGLLLSVAGDSSIDSAVRIGAYQELGNLTYGDHAVRDDLPTRQEIRTEVFQLQQSEASRLAEFTTQTSPYDIEVTAENLDESTIDHLAAADDLQSLRELIGDSSTSSLIRAQAVSSYVERLQGVVAEDQKVLEVARDSYELETQIREANIAITKMHTGEMDHGT